MVMVSPESSRASRYPARARSRWSLRAEPSDVMVLRSSSLWIAQLWLSMDRVRSSDMNKAVLCQAIATGVGKARECGVI